MKIYLVGGAVRDTLLGLPVKEKDYVVIGSTPEEMIARGFKPVGKDFPVFIDLNSKSEYALARTERKNARGYTGFEFYTSPTVTLEEDLKRRDLTINAMAMTDTGEIIDPYNGKQDLENKVLRHVSSAFVEDPVRILRVGRFYARFYDYGFTIAPETLLFMHEMVDNKEVEYLAPERVWQETVRALKEKHPEKFFEALKQCGALKKIFPEIEQLFGVPAKPQYHPEVDTGIHIMMALRAAACLTSDPIIRFAVLTHDLGKGLTLPENWPSHIDHEENGIPLLKAMCRRLRAPKAYSQLAELVMRYHGDCHRILEMQPKTILKKLEALDAFRRPNRFQQFLVACEADFKGRLGYEEKEYPQKDFFLRCFEAAKQVDVKKLVAEGLSNIQLAEAIQKERLSALRRSMD